MSHSLCMFRINGKVRFAKNDDEHSAEEERQRGKRKRWRNDQQKTAKRDKVVNETYSWVDNAVSNYSTSIQVFTNTPGVNPNRKVISYDRFRVINTFYHFVNNETLPEYPKTLKIQTIHD